MATKKGYPNASRLFSKVMYETTYEDLEQVLIDRMKIRIADSIGVTVAGRYGVGNEMVYSLLTEYGGRGEASVYNLGGKIPAANAAFFNSLQMRSNDFEPCHADGKSPKGHPAHITSSLFPAAFAVGERENASGKDIMTAIAVGDDLGARLSAAIGFNTNGLFDSNGTLNGMAAAACSAKLSGLDEEKIHHTLGIALNTLGGPMASTMEHSWLFKFPNANSARNGVFAADMARHGFTGMEDPILGKKCFIDMFSVNPNIDNLFENIGEIRYGEVIIKPYSSCCATHHAIKSILIATGGRAFDPQEVKEIRVHMLASKVAIVGGLWEPGEASQPFSAFSVQATTCNAVLHGGVYPEHQTPEALAGEQFQTMLTKYKQIPDLQESEGLASKVEIELVDGTILKGQCDEVRPGNMTDSDPLSIEYIHNKFLRNMKFGAQMPLAQAEEIWEMCMNFDQLESMRSFAELLTPSTSVHI